MMQPNEHFRSIDFCDPSKITCVITTNVKSYYGSKGNWIYHNTQRKVECERTRLWLDGQLSVHKRKAELDAV